MRTIKLFLVAITLLSSIGLFAQTPQAIPYQGVARNASGNILASQAISLRITIHDGAANGPTPFQEIHFLTTNNLGLFSANIGEGVNQTGGGLGIVNWALGTKFLQVEMDPAGGYLFVDLGTQQMMSVPYALFAANSATSESNKWSTLGANIYNNNNGHVGIGTLFPEFKLSLDNDGGILAKGTWNSGNTLTTSGSGVRMMWYPRKAAFRAGEASGSSWDDVNINYGSAGFGYATKASGSTSFAAGIGSIASGSSAVAFGDHATASGETSSAFGYYTTAGGKSSFAVGENNTASGDYSSAFGYYSTATGMRSFAAGNFNSASGWASTAVGANNIASSDYSSAFGNLNEARGLASFAAGYGNNSSSFSVGDYSFAAGHFNSVRGLASFAGGDNNTANGDYSTALGRLNNASGLASFAAGDSNITTGNYSSAFGKQNNVSGEVSTAFGIGNVVSGGASFAVGFGSKAEGDFSLALGTLAQNNNFEGSFVFGDASTLNGSFNYVKNTAANQFMVRADGGYVFYNDAALSTSKSMVFKGGKVGIGTMAPTNKLDVAGGMAVGNYAGGYAAPANGMIIQGNVGIGTSSPFNTLDVAGGVAVGAYAYGFGAPGNGMIISGNVGIGTSTTANRLDVEGRIAVGATYSGTTAAPTDGAIIEGSVGIGTTSPASKLDVEGSIAIGSTYSGTTAAPANGAIIEGRVGIGTSAPLSTVKLDVDGAVKVGINGTAITNIIKGAVNVDLPSIAANTSLLQTYTITNAAIGSTVSISFGGALPDGLVVSYARVSTANTIEVKFRNTSSTAADAGAMNFYITIIL